MFKRKFPMSEELAASAESAGHRNEAWKMLDKARLLQTKGADRITLIQQLDDLLVYMIKYLLPPIAERFEADVAEVATLLKDFKNFSHVLCSDASFCVAILRQSLKHYDMPVVLTKSWRPIAKQLCRVVMTA